jgi:hypothetical protein
MKLPAKATIINENTSSPAFKIVHHIKKLVSTSIPILHLLFHCHLLPYTQHGGKALADLWYILIFVTDYIDITSKYKNPVPLETCDLLQHPHVHQACYKAVGRARN